MIAHGAGCCVPHLLSRSVAGAAAWAMGGWRAGPMGNSVGGQCAQAEQTPDKAGLTSSALPCTQPQILKISRSFGERKAPVAILRGMRQAGERGRWQLLSAAAAAKAAATGGQLQAGVAGGGPRPTHASALHAKIFLGRLWAAGERHRRHVQTGEPRAGEAAALRQATRTKSRRGEQWVAARACRPLHAALGCGELERSLRKKPPRYINVTRLVG